MSLVELWVERVLLLMAVLLILYSGYLGTQITWLLVSPGSILSPSNEPSNLVERQPKRASSANINTDALGRWHLFGEFKKQSVVKQRPKPTIKAPETTLNLTLLGVFVAENDEDSTAIISTSKAPNDALLYGIGDSIGRSATLDAVYADKVLLNRNGRIETLRFPKATANGLTVSSREKRKPRANAQRGSRIQTEPGVFPEEILQHSDMALKFMGLEPSGPGQGYVITSGAPKEVLSNLPLRVGDRVLSINGVALGDPSTDQQMISQFLDERSVQVELQRGQTRMTVEVDVADLMGGG